MKNTNQDPIFMENFTKYCCILTGDDFYRLQQFSDPQSNKKIQLLAMLMLLPMFVWGITIFFVCMSIFAQSFFPSLFSGIVSAVVIFIIERSIIMSQGGFWTKVIRFSMAFLLAMVGSFFMDEIIFEQDINQKIMEMKNSRIELKTSEIDNDYKNEIKKQEEIIKQSKQDWNKRQTEVNDEAGGMAASGLKGAGSATKQKQKTADDSKQEYLEQQKKLDYLKSFEQQQILQQKKEKVAQQENEKTLKAGLMYRIDALIQLMKDSWIMLIFWAFLTGLFFLVEMLPVTIKLGEAKTLYEYHVEEHTKPRYKI